MFFSLARLPSFAFSSNFHHHRVVLRSSTFLHKRFFRHTHYTHRMWIPNQYPPTQRSDHLDVYKSEQRGEVTIHDPYEWLEHKSQQTEEWVSLQETFTRKYLDGYCGRQDLEEDIRKNMDYAKVIYTPYDMCLPLICLHHSSHPRH